ncbi:MAG: hypothetical protein EBX50_16970 [Chitinophagia bacterium]|nr:hypothetical protein [Chitinophagia bacterium]
MAKRVKARASARASVKVGATAQAIQAKRVANSVKGVKLPYADKGAMTLAQAIDKVASARKVNPYGKATGKALSANASQRREWCLKNLDACVIVKRETIQRKDIESENPRPENAIRVRLTTHANGKRIGYIRYLAVKRGQVPTGKHAESVILYRKA